jgi:DNA-binding response OmpR family regulator
MAMHTLLVADDDPIMLKLYELNLSRAGYRILSCKNGEEAFKYLETEKPVAMILDYLLPDVTGLELTQKFRQNPHFEKTPLIVVTAQGKESIRQDLMNAGASMVFTKPFSPSILLKSLSGFLN